jgi:hypothetical protein
MEAVDITSKTLLTGAERIRLAFTLFSDEQLVAYDRFILNAFDETISKKERCDARYCAGKMVDTAVKRGIKTKLLWDPDTSKAVAALKLDDRMEYDRLEIISKSILHTAKQAKEAKAEMRRLIAGVVCDANQLEKYDEHVAVGCRRTEVASATLNRAIDKFNINNDPNAPIPIGKNPWECASYQPAKVGGAYVQPEGPLIAYEDIEKLHTVDGRRVPKTVKEFTPMENYMMTVHKRGLPSGRTLSTKERNPAYANQFHAVLDETGKKKRVPDSELTPNQIELRNTSNKLASEQHILAREAISQVARERMESEGVYAIDGTRDVVRSLARQAMDEPITGICAYRWREAFPGVDGQGAAILQTLNKRGFMFYIGIHSDGDVTEPALCRWETSKPFTTESRHCIPSNLDGTLLELSEWRQAGFVAFNLMQFKTKEAAQWAEEVFQRMSDEEGIEQGYKIWRKSGSGRTKPGKRFASELEEAAGGPDAFTSVFISMVPCGEAGYNHVGEITSMRIGVVGTPGCKRVCIRPPNQDYIPTVDRVAVYNASIDNSLV